MSWTTYRNRPDAYLDEAFEVTAKRIAVSEYLMDNSDWDLMASVWVSIDRTQHALSNYIAPDHPDYAKNKDTRIGKKVADIFRQTDDAIGRFVSRARPDDLILFISDHGFQSCTRTVHMDHLLKQFGYLEFSASNVVFGPMQWGPVRNVARKVYDMLGLHGKVSLPQSVNWSKTKAFTTIRSTGEGVSINLAGREIDGIVDPGDYEKVRDEVMDRLGSFVDPKTGKKPIKAIHKREEIFKGEFADRAPDIMMVPAEGYSLAHAKSADRGRRLGERRPPARGHDRGGGSEREAVRVAAGADRHGADDRGGAGRAHRGDAEGPDPARDRRLGQGADRAGGDAVRPDPRHGRVRGLRQRGRRDGGAPPGPRLHRVGLAGDGPPT